MEESSILSLKQLRYHFNFDTNESWSLEKKIHSLLSSLFSNPNSSLPHAHSSPFFSKALALMIRENSSIVLDHFEANLKLFTGDHLLPIPAQNILKIIATTVIALKHDRIANIISLDLDVWNQALFKLVLPSMPYYSNKTYLNTTAMLLIETLVRLNKYVCPGSEMLKLITSLVHQSLNSAPHVILLVSSALKYLKMRKIIDDSVKKQSIKDDFIQSFCQSVLSDSNKGRALELLAFYQHAWDSIGQDGFMEGAIPPLKRALRRSQALLPLIKAILKEQAQYSKKTIALVILKEVLGEQLLLNEECLEAMIEVMQVIGQKVLEDSSQESKGQNDEASLQFLSECLQNSKVPEKRILILLQCFAFISSIGDKIHQTQTKFFSKVLDSLFDTLPLLIPDLRKKMTYLLTPLLEKCAKTKLASQNYTVSQNYYRKVIKSKNFPGELRLLLNTLPKILKNYDVVLKEAQNAISVSKITGALSPPGTLSTLYLLSEVSKGKMGQFIKLNTNITSTLLTEGGVFSHPTFLKGENYNEVETIMLYQVLLQYFSNLASKQSVLSPEVQRVIKNLLFIYLEGKGKLIFKQISENFPTEISKNIALVEAIFANLESSLENKIMQNGLAARHNDRIYRIVEASLISVDSAGAYESQGAFKLLKFLHSQTYHYHQENFQNSVKRLKRRSIEQGHFLKKVMEKMLVRVKEDLHFNPLTSKYLELIPRLGFTLNHLGLYDGQLHSILTRILRNSGNNLKPLISLKDQFDAQLDILSQHQVNYLASVVNDMLGLMQTQKIEVVEQEIKQVIEEVSKEEEPPLEEQSLPSLTSDMLLKQSMKKGKKGKKGKKESKSKPQKKETIQQAPKKAQSIVQAAPPLLQQTSSSIEVKYEISKSQIYSFISELQNKLEASAKKTLACFCSAHKAKSILSQITEHSLDEILLAVKSIETEEKAKQTLDFVLNTQKNSFIPDFNSHLIRMLSDAARKNYIQDKADIYAELMKALNYKPAYQRSLGEYKLGLKMAEFVLGANEAMLGVKELALNAVLHLMNEFMLRQFQEKQKADFYKDLTLMTMSLLSSNFNAHNLLQDFLRKVLQSIAHRRGLLYALVGSLFEYDPLCRVNLVRSLASMEVADLCLRPIADRSILVRMWLIQFDDNADMCKNARKIWNSQQFKLQNLLVKVENPQENLLFYLKHPDSMIQDMASKAIVSLIHFFPYELSDSVDTLLRFYQEEVSLLGAVRLGQKEYGTPTHLLTAEEYHLVKDTPVSQRVIVTQILGQCVQAMDLPTLQKVLDFIILRGSVDQDSQIRQKFVEIGVKIINSRGMEFSTEFLSQLNVHIQEDAQKNLPRESQNTSVILCANLAGYVSTETQGLKKLFLRVLELSKSSSLQELRAIAKALPHLAMHFHKLAESTISELLEIVLGKSPKGYEEIQSSSYALAGLMKGLGAVRIVQEKGLIERCRQFFKKENMKESAQQRLASFVLYRAMADVLGKTFEIFLKQVMPDILAGYSDNKDFVKLQVTKLMKAVVMSLSGFAVKQLIPLFLKGIRQDSWRTKLASAEALGSMAFCAPKQLSFFLPRIVDQLKDILTDAQPKVAESGIKALGSIGSVAQNPEVAEISNSLINALKDPEHGLTHSLDVLLKTNFTHLIDAPSLSLLIPVLYNGLFSQNSQNNINAAVVVGHICELIQKPQDLIPYLGIIMPALRATLFSADPQVRGTAALAVGSLSKGLGLQNSKELIIWLKSILKNPQGSSTQKSGAAHGLAEVITAHGKGLFEELLPELMENSRDQNGNIREAFRGVFAFLPKSYGQEFQKYFGYLLPLIMQGLSDVYDGVRSISTRTMRVLVEQYGTNHSQTFLGLLKEKALASDWRMRENALVLLTEFIESIRSDMHREQPIHITLKERNDILALLFMMKFDPNQKVNAICAYEWKHLVHNQPAVIRQVFNNLMALCCELVTDPKSIELQVVASECFAGIVAKFRDRFIPLALKYFRKELLSIDDDKAHQDQDSNVIPSTDISELLTLKQKKSTIQNKLMEVPEGYENVDNVMIVCEGMKHMLLQAEVGLLTPYRDDIVRLMLPLLISPQKHIRIDAANVIAILLTKTEEQEEEYLTEVFRLLIEQMQIQAAHSFQDNAFRLLEALQQLSTYHDKIEFRKMLLPIIYDPLQKYDVHSNTIAVFKEKLRPWHLRSLSTLANPIDAGLFRRKRHTLVLRFLFTTIYDINLPHQLCQGCVYALKKLAVRVPEEDLNQLWPMLDAFINRDEILDVTEDDKTGLETRNRYINYFCEIAHYFFNNHSGSYGVISEEAFRRLITLVSENNTPETNESITRTLQSLLAGLQQEHHQIFIPILASQLRIDPRSTQLLFRTQLGLETFITLTLNSVSHGTQELRKEAALAMRHILLVAHSKLSRPLIMKISGALIRVVMDRFGDQLKQEIYIAFDTIISNLNVATLAPQLQSTFTRALLQPEEQNDDTQLRTLVAELLVKTLKQKPRVEQVIRELEGAAGKIDMESLTVPNANTLRAITYCEALLLRFFSGKEISTNSRSLLLKQFQRRLEIEQTAKYAAIALGYLASHLLQEDLKSVWDQVIKGLDSELRPIAATAFMLSGSHDVVETYMPKYVKLVELKERDEWRAALLLNFKLLKKSMGKEKLVNKPSTIEVEQIDRGYAAVLTHYTKTVFQEAKDPLNALAEKDQELLAQLPLPHESDKLKLKELFQSLLKKMMMRKEGDLDIAVELGLKLGLINKFESDHIYGMEDLDEILTLNMASLP